MPIAEVGFPSTPGAADTLVFVGPTINVEIGFDPVTFAALAGSPTLPTPLTAPPIPAQVVPALIDTGAQQSMIDEALAVQLGLPLVNQQPVAGVGGTHVANVYLAHLSIPALGMQVQFGAFMALNCKPAGSRIKRS